jgi:CheY-like chemotaxis protein
MSDVCPLISCLRLLFFQKNFLLRLLRVETNQSGIGIKSTAECTARKLHIGFVLETRTNRNRSLMARSQLKGEMVMNIKLIPLKESASATLEMPRLLATSERKASRSIGGHAERVDNIKPKLLVVDDDHSVRASLRKLLEAEHYDVQTARGGVDALDYFTFNSTDLVVLDLNLSADDGWEVFQTMAEVNPFVPTIIITAASDQRRRAVSAGVEALIEKPIDVPAFLKTIRDLLAQTSEQRLKRICDDDKYCRYLARHSEPFLKFLNERQSTPLKLSSSLSAALSTLLIGESSDAGGNLIMASDASNSRKKKNSNEKNVIDREKASHLPLILEFR